MSLIAKLTDNWDQLQLKDRFVIKRKINQLRDKDNQKQMAAIEATIDQSVELTQLKQQQLPDIELNQSLPVSEKADEIEAAIKKSQVVIIAGETGSGKTTQIPKICMRLGLGIKGRIGHTQPRRLAARTVAVRIAEELKSPLGQAVGYQVRFQDDTVESTYLKLMTDGVLLSEIQHDPYLNQYDCLIIDEAHERSLNIDFLLGYLKLLLKKRPDIKIIITSATIDVERFSAHFEKAPVFEVSGRTYPVETHYIDDVLSENLAEQVVQGVDEILALEKQGNTPARGGDILAFFPGENEIRECAKLLRQQNYQQLRVLPLYARLTNQEQQQVFTLGGGTRRIVLATNVAETSVTVPGIHYVIDTGVARISRYSVRSKVQQLPIEKISQASANQRAGRCGRIAPGVCIRLYDEQDFINRPEFTEPEILRTNLGAVILKMLHLRLGDIQQFPFLQKPEDKLIRDGYRLLQELNAVNGQNKLTQVGRKMAGMPIDPRLARILIEAGKQNCVEEALIIVSGLSVQDPREIPVQVKELAKQSHSQDRDKESDFATLINLWNRWEEQRQNLSQNHLRKYAKKQFLNFMRMREWRDIHFQLVNAIKPLKLTRNQQPGSFESIHKSILSGFLSHVAQFQENNQFQAARNRTCLIHPSSQTNKKGLKWIVCAELIETSQLFARMVAKIDPTWVEHLAGHMVKKQYFEAHWSKKNAQALAFEKVTLLGLLIVAKRQVHYGSINAEESRELLIREALIAHHFNTTDKTLLANRKAFVEIEKLEAKIRKKDLLIDEQWLFEFYDERLAKNIVNGKGLLSWLKEEQNQKSITLSKDQLLNREDERLSKDNFPKMLQYGAMGLPLSYHFEPGSKNDGVTVTVPEKVLNQLQAQPFEWLVPGLIKEKCVALIKSLPKQLRKNFVPVPDFVDAFLSNAIDKNDSISRQLSAHLKRMTGVTIGVDDWQIDNINDHLRFNFKVVNSNGKVIRQGRDLLVLQLNAPVDTQVEIQPKSSDQKTAQIYNTWPDTDLQFKVQRKESGVQFNEFQALKRQGDGVEVGLFPNDQFALATHKASVLFLLRKDVATMEKFLAKSLPKWQQSALFFAPIGQNKQLLDDFFNAAVWQASKIQLDQLPFNKAQYDQAVANVKVNLDDVCKELALQLHEVLSFSHQIHKAIKGKVSFALAFIFSDIKKQLQYLVYPGFVYQTPVQWWPHLSRYLNGILKRIERQSGVPANEQMLIDEIGRYWQQYQDLNELWSQQQKQHPLLEEFRWMLEEYRVSLFAQTLKTVTPVSSKRLNKLWAQIKETQAI